MSHDPSPDRQFPPSRRETPWASATFTGARHLFHFLVEEGGVDAAARTHIASLAEAEWCLPGHIVADVTHRWGYADDAVARDPVMLTVEILTVADAAP